MQGSYEIIDRKTGEVLVTVIDMQDGRNYGECSLCHMEQRLDHAVGWYCGPTHDEIGSISTEYRGSDGEPAIVGGMCVCQDCHDTFYGIPLQPHPYEVFYNQIADLLETTHVFKPQRRYMRRWGDRTPGNGRFPGHGIVRAFSETNIHMALHTPVVSGTYQSFREAVQAVRSALATHGQVPPV